ncbi:unnamed protein product, partial [Timema podura]|nr:unnamed protein product [Timema podura]
LSCIIISDVCSHGRSKDYFIESITSPIIFNATLCYSWNDYIKGRCKDNPTVAMGAYTPTRTLDFWQARNSPPPKGSQLNPSFLLVVRQSRCQRKVLFEYEQRVTIRTRIKLFGCLTNWNATCLDYL